MKKFLVVFFALIVPPAVYFSTIGQRRQEEIAQLDGEVANVEMHLQHARAVRRRFGQFREETARLADELVKLRRILPSTMQIDDLRASVVTRAAETGVRLTKFEPGRIDTRAPLQQIFIDAEVVGDAASLPNFFVRLSNMSRVVNVSYVTLRPDPAGWRAGLVISAYALPD
jgi:Tfp pilus assembly protein PilO